MLKYKLIEHTADIGIRVYGAGAKDLFGNAAYALFCIIVEDIETILEEKEEQISVEAQDLEGLLVRWLSELYYRYEVDRLLFRRFDILKVDDKHITARIYGEKFDAARHRLKTDIKGVTYHGLHIRQNKDIWEAEVIFDV